MRFCYADPPYPGMARLYKNHPDYAGEVDHKALIERLVAEFPDGWALSTSQTALRDIWNLCPDKTTLLVWYKPTEMPRPWIKSHLIYSWEPVLLFGGRPLGFKHQVRNVLVESASRLPGRFMGAKPEIFCFWLFRCLGCLPGDEMVDLFPGSGAVGRAWGRYQRQMRLPFDEPQPKQLKFG